jgi:hypothetical protein
MSNNSIKWYEKPSGILALNTLGSIIAAFIFTVIF